MIKTATDEELRRIANRLYEPIATEFAQKLAKIDSEIYALKHEQMVQADAEAMRAEAQSKETYSIEYRMQQMQDALIANAAEIWALNARAKRSEDLVVTQFAANQAAREKQQEKIQDVLRTIARWENDLK